MGDQQLGFGIFENKLDFPGREAVIEGNQNGPDKGGGKIGFQKNMTIILEDGHRTARSQAPGPQKMRQSKDPFGKLPIGKGGLMAANRLFLRIGPGGFK